MTRRKTAAEKRRSGTYRADRDRDPPETPQIEPMMPKTLSDEAKAIWRAHAPALVDAGLLSSVDGPTFGLLCTLAAKIESCYAAGEIPSRDVMANFRPLAAAFGMNPDARHKLAIEADRPKSTGSDFDDV